MSKEVMEKLMQNINEIMANRSHEGVWNIEDVGGDKLVYLSSFGMFSEAKIIELGFPLPDGLAGIEYETEMQLERFLGAYWVAKVPPISIG